MKPFLSPMFGSHMVLQRGIKAPVWGWAAPGTTVTVAIAGKSADAVAGADGRWLARIGPLKAGGPHTLTVNGPKSVTLDDVLVGDVWVASGQSNMEMTVAESRDAAKEIAAANYPRLRLYKVNRCVALEPQDIPVGHWDECAPSTVSAFSAIAYYFGREVHTRTDIPIGLVETCWGGTVAEAWTSAEALAQIPDFAPALAKNRMLKRQLSSNPKSVDLSDQPNLATVLFNGMVAPVIPFGIKGAIWYQGSSNAARAYQYRTLLPTMINDWRARWGVGDFPFYIGQLYNYMAQKPEPGDDEWAELREAQSMTAKALPHSGIAVAIDIGETETIHPLNKQDLGRRLALNALAKDYGKKVEYSGPDYQSMKVESGKIRLTFTHIGGGLVAKGGKLTGFAIAGVDRKFVWADVVIDGESVVVSSSGVPEPVAVRYAWASNPVCNLYNKGGLPASPFRTDDWPGITQPK
ncbi:MAG TPA: sialate O-acetylesterase [Armatimonadota bacterium]|jgi:sialate O-acetylesterase